MIPNAWEGYPIFQGLLHQVKPLMRSPFMSDSSAFHYPGRCCIVWGAAGPRRQDLPANAVRFMLCQFMPILGTSWPRRRILGPPVCSIYSLVIITSPIFSSLGISYMISSMYSSKIARSALAPVCFSNAILAMAPKAPSSNSSFTSSSASSFWYCFKMAFLGL